MIDIRVHQIAFLRTLLGIIKFKENNLSAEEILLIVQKHCEFSIRVIEQEMKYDKEKNLHSLEEIRKINEKLTG